jgi:hypothetical protein
MYRSEYGAIGPVSDSTDINGKWPLAVLWSDITACAVILDYERDAYDVITQPYVLATSAGEYIIASPDDQQIVVSGGDYVGQPFESYYCTRWLHAGWPDRKKSWRRPTFICKEVQSRTELLVESFRDYNDTTVRRTRRLVIPARGQAYWSIEGYTGPDEDGFDWTPEGADDPTGTGADWATRQGGSKIVRGGSLGLAKAVQMKISATPDSLRRPWGVDGIVAKLVLRRFR